MDTRGILALTFVPLVVVLALLGLIFAWLRMRRPTQKEVVDLVNLTQEPQRPLTNNEDCEGRTSTEPFPQLPSLGLIDDGGLMSPNLRPRSRSYSDLHNTAKTSPQPIKNTSHHRTNALTTPPPQFTTPTKSPSREALAAFDFRDMPTKPPLPARSIKRASGSLYTPLTTTTPTTPTIKVESPSSSTASPAINTVQPRHLSPTMIGRTHAQETIQAAKNASADEIKPLPFSSVPVTHISNPTSDDLPPTPARASAYLRQDLAQQQNEQQKNSSAHNPNHTTSTQQQQTLLKRDREHKSPSQSRSMIGKRNSAIREYVRNFPEQNPWRKMMARRSRDVEAQAQTQI